MYSCPELRILTCLKRKSIRVITHFNPVQLPKYVNINQNDHSFFTTYCIFSSGKSASFTIKQLERDNRSEGDFMAFKFTAILFIFFLFIAGSLVPSLFRGAETLTISASSAFL